MTTYIVTAWTAAWTDHTTKYTNRKKAFRRAAADAWRYGARRVVPLSEYADTGVLADWRTRDGSCGAQVAQQRTTTTDDD